MWENWIHQKSGRSLKTEVWLHTCVRTKWNVFFFSLQRPEYFFRLRLNWAFARCFFTGGTCVCSVTCNSCKLYPCLLVCLHTLSSVCGVKRQPSVQQSKSKPAEREQVSCVNCRVFSRQLQCCTVLQLSGLMGLTYGIVSSCFVSRVTGIMGFYCCLIKNVTVFRGGGGGVGVESQRFCDAIVEEEFFRLP